MRLVVARLVMHLHAPPQLERVALDALRKGATEAIAAAVTAERARFDGLLLAVKDMLSNTCLSEARFVAESRALSEYKRLSGPNIELTGAPR